jgi:hypothetical protein
MVVRNIQKIGTGIIDPFVSQCFAAGVAESGFTGVGNIFFLSALRTFIQMIAHFILIAASHYLFYVLDNRSTYFTLVFFRKPRPIILED